MRRIVDILPTTIIMFIVIVIILVNSSIVSLAETGATRQLEVLNRGLVSSKLSTGVYLSWRLLGTEDTLTTFNVYRDNQFIANVTDSTNYTDTTGTSTSNYQVAPVFNQIEGSKCTSVTAFLSGSNYFDIPIQKPSDFVVAGQTYPYTAGDASTGDLDGDGEYEIILKWEANPKDNSQDGVTGNVYIDAYKLNGTYLWRIDLGPNIRAGGHYTQIMVYDLDGDGKAEITCKTAPGSLDGLNNFVSSASIDSTINSTDNSIIYKNSTTGRILTGPEYYTVFDGENGAAIDTVAYPITRDGYWGDTYGNRVDRFLAAVAYLDGVTPSVIAWRGYYTRITAVAYTLKNGRLVKGATFDTNTDGTIYEGQGNHSLAVADVDGDGFDEIICGAICLDNDLTVKWCSFRGHGDAHHIGDYDPTNPGLEYFSVHESSGMAKNGKMLDCGMTLYDAGTGKELFHNKGTGDTGRGIMANIGAGGYFQFWGAGAFTSKGFNTNGTYVLTPLSASSKSTNFRIFWDGDLYEELLDGISIAHYSNGAMNTIFSATGCVSINGTKANPTLQADLFGDWREEVVYPFADFSALRVFTTNIATKYKLPTLMHDSTYRLGVATENVAYNQPPHIGYILNEDTFLPVATNLSLTPPSKTVYSVGESLDFTGMVLKATYKDGTQGDVTSYLVSGYNSSVVGVQKVNIIYRGRAVNFSVEVTSDFDFDSTAQKITGYHGTASNPVLPTSVNGVNVLNIANYAFKQNSVLQSITILNDVTIGTGAFEGCNLTVHCYESSTAHLYALDNLIPYAIMENNQLQYITKNTFEETPYTNIIGALDMAKILQQTKVYQSTSINGISYSVNGRSLGGDGTTGFYVAKSDSGYCLQAKAGKYSSDTKVYFNIIDSVAFSDNQDYVFEMKLNFIDTGFPISISISDGTTSITTISKESLGLEHNIWYNYYLIYNSKSGYTQIIKDSNGQIVSQNAIASTVNYIKKLNFSTPNSTTNLTSTQYAAVNIDNLKLYSLNKAFCNVTFNATDKWGAPIADATINVGAVGGTTNSAGKLVLPIFMGTYQAVVDANDFYTNQIYFSAKDSEKEYNITPQQYYHAVTGVSLSDQSKSIVIGKQYTCQASVLPSNASIRDVVWSSSDLEIATVSNGVVTTLSKGSATITATTSEGNFIAQCQIDVIPEALDSITIEPPSKVRYLQNTDLDLSDMVVTAIYNSEKKEMITEYTVNGYNKASSGTQTITVTYQNKTASFTVNVIAPNAYVTNTPTTIRITGGQATVYKPTVGSQTTKAFIATVYDQIDSKITGGLVDWSISPSIDGVSIDSTGIITVDNTVSVNQNIITLKASSKSNSNIFSTTSLSLIVYEPTRTYTTNVNYDGSEYASINMAQTTTVQETTIGDITYHVGARSGVGDFVTGFYTTKSGTNQYLEAKAGPYSSADRNAWFTIGTSPVFNNSLGYVLEMDFKLPSKGFTSNTITITFSDGTTGVASLNALSLNLSLDTWYKYQLLYQNGAYLQVLYNDTGKIISTTEITSAVTKISKLNFNYITSYQNASIYIDNLKLYSLSSALSPVTIKVTDYNNQPLEGATIKIGQLGSAITFNGIATFTLPIGVFDAVISANKYNTFATKISCNGEEIKCTIPMLQDNFVFFDVISNKLARGSNNRILGSLSLNANNPKANSIIANIVMATYENEKLISTILIPKTTLISGNNTLEFKNVYVNNANIEKCKIIVYMLDSFDKMIPIARKINLNIPTL